MKTALLLLTVGLVAYGCSSNDENSTVEPTKPGNRGGASGSTNAAAGSANTMAGTSSGGGSAPQGGAEQAGAEAVAGQSSVAGSSSEAGTSSAAAGASEEPAQAGAAGAVMTTGGVAGEAGSPSMDVAGTAGVAGSSQLPNCGTASIGAITSSGGSGSISNLGQTIALLRPELRTCYRGELATDLTLEWPQVVATITVDASSVATVAISGSTAGASDAFLPCLIDTFQSITWQADAASHTVSVPMRFVPSGC